MTISMNNYLLMGTTGFPGALDLATCVSNADLTQVRASPNAPSVVAYNSDGSEAWCNGTAASTSIGITLTTPYLLPGPSGSNNAGNGNSITASTAVESSWKWSQDGLYLYNGKTAQVRTLSTPFLLSTATITSVNTAMNSTRGSTITSDGLRVYLAESGAGNRIFRWDLSVPWDLTTAVQDVANVSLNIGEVGGIAISNDESRIYIATTSPVGIVSEYIMSTPGDLTTIPSSLGLPVSNYNLTVSYADLPLTTCLYISYDMSHMLVGGSDAGPSRCGFYSLTGSPV